MGGPTDSLPGPCLPDGPEPGGGVVMAGAAARGPVSGGALAALLPRLAEAGLRPTVFIGTSSGEINAALTAQHAGVGIRGHAARRHLQPRRHLPDRAGDGAGTLPTAGHRGFHRAVAPCSAR